MYFLDTDILTLVHAGHPKVASRRQAVTDSDIAISIITRIEILQGRYAALLKSEDASQLLKRQELLERAEERLGQIRTISLDEGTDREFDRLLQNKKLKKIGRGDLLIAALVLGQRATLVSRNVRDFRQVPGLRVENWAD